MTTKKYTIMLALTAAAGLFGGCSDALDVSPDGNISIDDVLSDPVKVEALLSNCYERVPMKANGGDLNANLIVACSDDAWSSLDLFPSTRPQRCYGGECNHRNHFLRDNSKSMSNNEPHFNGMYWKNSWTMIYACSNLIENIDKAAVRTESDRARFKAEAQVMRAFYYSELVRYFGKLPVLKTTAGLAFDYSGLKRQPVHDVAEFVYEDCDAAIACPELPWRNTTDKDAMRATKALAWAIKSRMSLVVASPLFCEGQNYWQEAYDINKKALAELTANGYELFTKCTQPNIYGDGAGAAFRQISAANADYSATPRDKETIWAHSLTDAVKRHGNYPYACNYIGVESGVNWIEECPTQELIDAFETTDGQPVLDLAKPYLDEQHLQPNFNKANTLYDEQNPYANRDPRLHETALCNGDKFIWKGGEVKTVESYKGGKHEPRFSMFDFAYSRTSYYLAKWTVPGCNPDNKGEHRLWKYFRLAEIYLNLAEAAVEAGQLADAKANCDIVRARVQMPALPSGLTQDQLRLRVRNERRVELAFEETRYFDVRRWQQPDGDLHETSKWFTGMTITKQADGSFTYQRRNIWDKPRDLWQNKDLVLPINAEDVNRMVSLTGDQWQNPGWQ